MRRVPPFAVPVFAALAGLPSAIWPGTNAAHLAYLGGFATIVLVAWLRMRTLHGPTRGGYAFIAAALTVWLAGDLLYDLLTLIFGELGDVTPSDALWVSGYPLLAAGLIRLTRVRAPGRLREGLLDGLAMATVVAWLFWQYLILPAAQGQRLSLAVAVAAFYPFGDVLLFAAIAVLVLTPGSKRGSTPYLVAALSITLVGDLAISTLPALIPALSRAGQADRFDGVLLLANSLLVAALVHPRAARMADPTVSAEQRLHPSRVMFLGIALLVLPTMAGLHSFSNLLSRVSLIGSVVLLTALILVRFVFVVREQERIRAALAYQAEHDQLTGLANRKALQHRVAEALVRREGYGPVAFYLDLNGFKQINDRYGHAAGDYVLVEFSRRLTAALRASDTAARVGGDEFVVLSEDLGGAEDALAVAARLSALVDEPVRHGDELYPIGVAIGMASAEEMSGADVDTLLAAADAQMYRQKTASRAPRQRATESVR